MKNVLKRFAVIVFAAVITLALAGCGPTVESVTVNADGGAGSVKAGESLQFNVRVVGKNNPSQNVRWSVSSTSDGSGAIVSGTDVSPSGTLTVAAKETASALYIKAVSTQDSGKFDYKQVKVETAVATPAAAAAPRATVTAVDISPANPTIRRNDKETFTVKVTGTNNPSQNVTWKVARNLDGTGNLDSRTVINSKGELTVDRERDEFYVIATSTVDSTKFGATKVTIGNRRSNNQQAAAADTSAATGTTTATDTSAATGTTATATTTTPTVSNVTVTPESLTLAKGGTQKFTASVTGNNNPGQGVTWRISSNSGGTGNQQFKPETKIDANGSLTVAADESRARLFVIATSTVDTSKIGSARVDLE